MNGRHHLLFERRLWRAHEPNDTLRSMPGLIVPYEMVGEEAHDLIHRTIDSVPPPSYRLGQAILKQYRDNPDDHLRAMNNLLRAVDKAIRDERTRSVGYKTGLIILEAIELQREVIFGDL